MSTIPLVALFKEQLENESSAIAEKLGLSDRGERLVWWYFLKLVGLTESEIEEVYVKVEAIWVSTPSI